MAEKTIRCTRCRAEFTDAEIEGAPACPTCSDLGVPMLIENDVTISINWHELRILCMWADNWIRANPPEDGGHDSSGALRSVIQAIAAQHPERSPLTLGGEFQQLADSPAVKSDVEVQHGDGTKSVYKKRELN